MTLRTDRDWIADIVRFVASRRRGARIALDLSVRVARRHPDHGITLAGGALGISGKRQIRDNHTGIPSRDGQLANNHIIATPACSKVSRASYSL